MSLLNHYWKRSYKLKQFNNTLNNHGVREKSPNMTPTWNLVTAYGRKWIQHKLQVLLNNTYFVLRGVELLFNDDQTFSDWLAPLYRRIQQQVEKTNRK